MPNLKISNIVTLDENEGEISAIRAQRIADSGALGHIEALELPEEIGDDN